MWNWFQNCVKYYCVLDHMVLFKKLLSCGAVKTVIFFFCSYMLFLVCLPSSVSYFLNGNIFLWEKMSNSLLLKACLLVHTGTKCKAKVIARSEFAGVRCFCIYLCMSEECLKWKRNVDFLLCMCKFKSSPICSCSTTLGFQASSGNFKMRAPES